PRYSLPLAALPPPRDAPRRPNQIARFAYPAHSLLRSLRRDESLSGHSGHQEAGRRREMEPLARMSCVACQAGEPTVSEAESREYLKQLPDWQIINETGVPQLVCAFTFPDFASALAFTDRV